VLVPRAQNIHDVRPVARELAATCAYRRDDVFEYTLESPLERHISQSATPILLFQLAHRR